MTGPFDIIVIGGGPGGYVAAIRGAQLGFQVALVEKNPSLGGTCLNVGCIPSKALLDSSELYYQATHSLKDHGIHVKEATLDFQQMQGRKDEVVRAGIDGLDFLMKKNKIQRFIGVGAFIDPHTVQVTGKDNVTIHGRHIVVATGSEPVALPFAPFDGKRVLSSADALALSAVPKKLLVIGGGFIGLEIGSIYARLGSEVTVLEFMGSIIPTMDRGLSQALQRSLKALGFHFHLQTKVTDVKATGDAVTVSGEKSPGKKLTWTADHVLVAVGRRAYTDALNLNKVNLTTDPQGRLTTNDKFQTACESIYAIGDVVAGPMLAHKAEEEGVAVAEIIAGQKPEVDRHLIPSVVYTWPEVASVGKTEEELKAKDVEYRTGTFPFKASGRARAAHETEGFVKVLADSKTDEILGVHMIGPRCSDLIGEAVVAMTYRAAAEDLARIVHAHPTFSESLKEASLIATANRALHL